MSGEPTRQRHVYVHQPGHNKPKPTSSKSGRKKPDVVSSQHLKRLRVRLPRASAPMLQQCWNDSSDTVLIELKTIESPQKGLQLYSGATPLFSMRTVSLASLQSCRSVDADAWCVHTLTGCKIM